MKECMYSGKITYDKTANQGIGAHKALMVIFEPEDRSRAEALVNALSAGVATHEREMIVPLSAKQIAHRISSLHPVKHANLISEFTRAKESLASAGKPAEPAVQRTAKAAAQTM